MKLKWDKTVPGTDIVTVTLIDEGREKAFAVVHKKDGKVYIADIQVATGNRKKGYGKKLVQAIERKYCDKPRVFSLLSNVNAINFWKKIGYIPEQATMCDQQSCSRWMTKPCKKKR